MAFKNARKKQCSQLKVMSQMKFLNKLELELLRIDVAVSATDGCDEAHSPS